MSGGFRKFVLVLALLGALAAAALAVGSSPWFHRYLERRVIAGLEAFTGGRVELGAMQLNPLVLQMSLGQVVIHGSEPAAQPALFVARTLVLRFSPSSLFRRRLILLRLDLAHAEIHLRTNPDGSTNLSGPETAVPPVGPERAVPLLWVGRLTVTDTNLHWNDRRLSLEFSALGVALQMSRDRHGNSQGTVAATDVQILSPRGHLPATTFTARFALTPSHLSVRSFQWNTPGFAGQGSGEWALAPQLEGHLSFQASGSVAEIFRMLKFRSAMAGGLEFRGEATYANDAWKSEGQIRGHLVPPRNPSLDTGPIELSSHFAGDARHVELRDLMISGMGGSLDGIADVSLTSPTPAFAVRARLRGLRLGNTLAALASAHPLLAQLHWAGSLQGSANASWKGRFDDLKAQFALQIVPPVAPRAGTIPVTGSLRGSFTNRPVFALELEQGAFSMPHSTLTARGGTGGAQVGIGIELVTSDFEEWRAPAEFLLRRSTAIPLELKSTAKFSGRMAGPMNRIGQPQIRGHLTLGQFDYRGWRWDNLQADVFASPESVEISEGRVQSGQSVLELTALASLRDWELYPGNPARVSASVERTPLAGLQAALGFHYPVAGLVTGKLDLQGTAEKLTGAGDLRVEHGNLAGRPFDSLSFQLRIGASAWSIENIELLKGPARTSGHGSYDLSSGVFSVRVHGERVSLADFQWGKVAASPKGGAPLEGIASFDLEGQGTLNQIHLRAAWRIQQLKVEGTTAGDFHGQLQWESRNLQFQGESEGPGGSLRFQGQAQPENSWPAELHGEFDHFKADPWVRLVMGEKFSAQVNAGGNFSLRGPLAEPREMSGESHVEKLEVKTSDLAWTNVQPVELHYAQGQLTVSRFHMQGPSTSLEIGGTVRFGARSSLALTAQGDSDAKLLSLFDPALQAAGRSQADLRIQGSPAHPLLYGALKVQDVNLSYGDLPFHLFSLNGEIRLEGDRATVRGLRGVSGGGSVTVRGFVTLAETPRIQIQAQVDQVRVQYPADFTSSLDGTLRLSGSPDSSRLEGDLRVRQLTVNPSFSVLGLLAKIGGPSGAPAIGVASPVGASMRLNILLSSSPAVRFETHDLRVAADIDLRLQGTLAQPVVLGSIHLLNGEAVLRGNRFTIDRGDINMSNPFRTEPVLDLQATTRLQHFDVTLDISGPLDRVKVAYRSDPPLPAADILSLLALGYSRQSEQMSTSANERTSTVGASALLSQALSSQVTGRIQRIFGVSRIKVDPNVGGTENVSGARVTVEQQITRDLTLTYITDTASSQRRVIQFEWSPAENFSLLGVRDQNGIFGMEIRFRKRFH